MQFLGRYLSAFVSALRFNLARYGRAYALAILCLLIVGISAYSLLIAPPHDFPVGETFTVTKGEATPAIAADLAAEHVIQHPQLFALLARALGSAGHIEAGPYLLDKPITMFTVLERLHTGDSGIAQVRLTIPEGLSVREMAPLIVKKFPAISASDFVAAAGPYEGQLFPDTYQFAPGVSAADIVATMYSNFEDKILPVEPAIAASGHSLGDIIIMASIIEKEANNPTDRRLVAGVLWNRISKGISLQVDAPFGYLQSKPEYSPSLADLSIDSPYNTYENKGLPPGPIGNPGLDSIIAAASPTKTKYLFYLTGRDGLNHYATTYAEHLANQKKYLR